MRDREIVAAIVAGDPTGLAAAYDKYAESLYGYCDWMLGGSDRAADAVQDTFVIAAANLGGLRDPRRLRPWLYAAARSECHRRLCAGEAGLDEAAGLADPSAGAGDNAERPERRELVRAVLDGLGPGEREVLELGLRHDLSGADLAAVLGVSRNQAHAFASRARGRLERELGVLLVARTGRWACPTLDVMLHDWDGQLTAPMRKQVARHTGQCDACAYRRRSAPRRRHKGRLRPGPPHARIHFHTTAAINEAELKGHGGRRGTGVCDARVRRHLADWRPVASAAQCSGHAQRLRLVRGQCASIRRYGRPVAGVAH
jgi:RNA polymerase sigma factor (sigma-70 family)